MKVSDFQLGEAILIQVQPKSLTIKGWISVLSMSGRATIIGTDTSINETRPLLIGWKEGETPMHKGKVGHPTATCTYLADMEKLNTDYPNQLWIELGDVAGKISAMQVASGAGATCKCGWFNPYAQAGVYVCQNCKLWAHVAS